jgi:hypothetical protein
MFSIQHHFFKQQIFNHTNIPSENGHKHYKTLNIFNHGWTTNLSTINTIAFDALVMFTKKHQCISKGVVNGATTTIASMVFDPQKLFLKNCPFEHKYIYDRYYYKTSF